MSQPHDLMYAAETLLDFMALRRGEDVVISADTMGDARVAEALLTVAQRQGAKAVIATMSALPFQGQLANQHVPAALSRAVETCDLWIDLAFPYYAGAHVHDQAMKAQRARYLLVGDLKADGFHRMFGQLDFDAYFRAQALFDELFNASVGRTCRITTPLGTDVSFTLATGCVPLQSPPHPVKRWPAPGVATSATVAAGSPSYWAVQLPVQALMPPAIGAGAPAVTLPAPVTSTSSTPMRCS